MLSICGEILSSSSTECLNTYTCESSSFVVSVTFGYLRRKRPAKPTGQRAFGVRQPEEQAKAEIWEIRTEARMIALSTITSTPEGKRRPAGGRPRSFSFPLPRFVVFNERAPEGASSRRTRMKRGVHHESEVRERIDWCRSARMQTRQAGRGGTHFHIMLIRMGMSSSMSSISWTCRRVLVVLSRPTRIRSGPEDRGSSCQRLDRGNGGAEMLGLTLLADVGSLVEQRGQYSILACAV